MKTMEEWILNYNNPKGPFRNLSDLLHAIRDEALDAAAEKILAETAYKMPGPQQREYADAIRALKEQP